ncbi:MAG: hypothetical protein R3B72_51435 [Polyangiaceae bacterium]
MRRAATIALLVSALARPAAADPTPEDVAAADAAFAEGKRLAKDGDYEKACAAFEKSQTLAPGSGTLLNLGNCYERLGRLATAWATFRAAAASARDHQSPARAREALARAAALESRLSRLLVVVPDDARRPGLSIAHDGVPLDEALWNDPLPVDPGEHLVRVEAPGHRPFERRLTVGNTASRVEIIIPPLAREGDAPPPAPVAPASDVPWITGLAIGGVGIAAVGAGLGIGIEAIILNGRSNDAGCRDGLCTPEGLDLRNRALTLSHVSTAVTTAGLVHVAAGLVLWLTAPEGEPPVEPVAEVGAGRFTLGMRGAF